MNCIVQDLFASVHTHWIGGLQNRTHSNSIKTIADLMENTQQFS